MTTDGWEQRLADLGQARELREAIARWLWNVQWNDGDQDPDPANAAMPWDEAHPVQQALWVERADALLSGPLAPLLAAQAAVERVEALWARHESPVRTSIWPTEVGAALDGPT